MLGKQDNCQVAVSVSLACDQGSVPVAWQLYLPEDWAADPKRRAQTGVPEELRFATKTRIALAQLRTLLAEGAPHHCVWADAGAGYGVDTAFRQTLSDMGLAYAVGVTSAVVVWPPGVEPLPPKPYSGTGRPPVMPQRTAQLQPMSAKALALSLPTQAFHTTSWREGTNEPVSGRFAAVRVRHASGNAGRARLRPLQWLLIEWPAGDAQQSNYVLSTLPDDTPINELVSAANQRWRIERDYQDLKQDFGLGHCEGRGWRGFHHHASLSIAAHGFLMAERLNADKPAGSKKTSSNAKCLPFPRITSRAAVLRAQRHVKHSITTLRLSLSYALLARLGQCSCCGGAGAKLLLCHSKTRCTAVILDSETAGPPHRLRLLVNFLGLLATPYDQLDERHLERYEECCMNGKLLALSGMYA